MTEPIAKALGVDDLIATEPEIVEGRFTGRIQGVPSYKAGKGDPVGALAQNPPVSAAGSLLLAIRTMIFHCLSASGPVAVDADAELTRVAKERAGNHVITRIITNGRYALKHTSGVDGLK